MKLVCGVLWVDKSKKRAQKSAYTKVTLQRKQVTTEVREKTGEPGFMDVKTVLQGRVVSLAECCGAVK